MRNLLRTTLLASIFGVGLGGAATSAVAADSLQANTAPQDYFIFFNEPGAVDYQGGVPGLARTAPQRSGVKFDASRPEVVSYRAHLARQQDERIAAFEQAIGRSLEVTYRYDVIYSGIVARLAPDEAAELATMPGVREVEIVKQYELATDRGPTFIGADTIWNGTSTGGLGGYRGEGMVIGVLDTGVNLAGHPSFANDASCGFSASFPKLKATKDCIGSATCAGASPVDSNGHGSHTASTAGGNTHVATGGAMAGTQISGIAPCAQLITYKVCPTNSCDGAAIAAAIQTALIDQVDALNYSISGGQNPWSSGDSDRGFLDLVDTGTFVAASAGNTSTAVPNPIGQVNHRGPWVMTVANSTHDRINKNRVDVAGGPQDVYGLKSTAPFNADITGAVADSQSLGNLEGCIAGGGFPGGSMTGKIALIQRGSCNFSEKIANAATAGAIGVIIYNSNVGQPPIVMDAQTATSIPSVMISNADGLAIRTFVVANPTAQATVDSTTVFAIDPIAGDNLNAGSLRGPIAGGIEVTKPDITGPGTNIMAAVSGPANAYDFLSGTSMSSPHLAGSGALLVGLRPSWTPQEVKSAIQMTADKTGLKDYVNGTPNNGPWDADDVGNGRVDLTKAALAGLVLHETKTNFLAANGNVANQRALNIPSMRNTACTPSCTWTRTVRNTLQGASSWTVSGDNITPGFDVEVSPASFSFTGAGIPAADTIFTDGFETPVEPETQTITITATPTTDLTGAVAFGEVVFAETGDRSPELHMTIAIKGEGEGSDPIADVDPANFDFTVDEGASDSDTMTIGNIGGGTLTYSIAEAPVAGGSIVLSQTDGATTQITQSTSLVPVALASVACGVQGQPITRQNSYWRRFYFDEHPAIGASASIVSVDIGVEATSGQTLTVNLYTIPSSVAVDTIPTAQLTLIGTANVPVAGGTALTTVNVPVTGTVADTSASDLVVEVNAPDGQPNSTNFYVGANGQGQTHPSFLSAPNCSINQPTPTAGIGFPNMHIVMAVNIAGGGEPGVCDSPADVPWLSVSPTSGNVNAGDSVPVNVSVNSAGLAVGDYSANLCITTNDTTQSLIEVPVSLTVEDGGGGGDIVVHNNVNFVPNADGTGSSVRWDNPADTCNCDTAPYDFNVWASSGNLAFFWPRPATADEGGVGSGGVYSVLPLGAVVGPTSTFVVASTTAASANWRQGGNVDGYLGFRFRHPVSGIINYGYARIQTTGATGFPATIVGWAYNSAGDPITVEELDGGGGVTVDVNFANVADLFATGGWFQVNRSNPLGASTYTQGAAGSGFPAQDGSETEFAVVNFNSTTGAGTISNWMLTPEITFDSNTSLTFYTRTGTASEWPDRLEVRVSTTGAGTNVGALATDVGDFTTLLLEVNPTLAVGGYPETWTQFTVDNAAGIPTSGSGRIAFRYFVTNGGPSGTNSNIIGFDTLSITAAAVATQPVDRDGAPSDPQASSARSN